MDDNLYDEFGNYIGPDIVDQVIIKTFLELILYFIG